MQVYINKFVFFLILECKVNGTVREVNFRDFSLKLVRILKFFFEFVILMKRTNRNKVLLNYGAFCATSKSNRFRLQGQLGVLTSRLIYDTVRRGMLMQTLI